MQFLKYWPYGLAALALLVLSCFISYCVGVSDGRKQEQSTQALVGAKATVKAVSTKENVKNATRKLSDPDIDNSLTANGWMRSDTDR
ncbi:DUF2681 domain-containing protein [Dyadobacter sp. CY323]|uniref:DUF2681 domain-containing protein n=1 Tax=Dyadobacter sp. CY323 TaxID=2907302 RepID=UPI001F412873|nr:DUF2681 domain-containing protein [Dyadobacter sp. CY323]MCE6993128.1 DUF2681 domain-containing protein [Dyadobacter sp. CY323]